MAKLPKLTRDELLVFAHEFIDHFGNLGELVTIRHVLQGIEARLGDLVDTGRAELEERVRLRDMLYERLSLLIGGAPR